MDAPDSTNVSTERVKFDDATSDAFANACRGVAQNIDNTLPGLKSSLTKALEDFEGHYAEITAANIDTAVSDGRDIANILRQLATVVDRLKEAAHKETRTATLCTTMRLTGAVSLNGGMKRSEVILRRLSITYLTPRLILRR